MRLRRVFIARLTHIELFQVFHFYFRNCKAACLAPVRRLEPSRVRYKELAAVWLLRAILRKRIFSGRMYVCLVSVFIFTKCFLIVYKCTFLEMYFSICSFEGGFNYHGLFDTILVAVYTAFCVSNQI